MPARSKTKMCNQALTLFGAKMITDFDTPTDENGRLCDLLWDDTVDEVLARHDWKCAIHRKEVAADADEPTFPDEYQVSYTMPANPYCLRVISIWLDDSEITDWVREGRKIMSTAFDSDDEMQFVYIKRITNPAEFTPHLAKAIVHTLGVNLAFRRSQSEKTIRRLELKLESVLIEAWSVSEMEDYVQTSSNTWQDAGTS